MSSRSPVYVLCLLLALLALPLALQWVPPNPYYGVRPWRGEADTPSWVALNTAAGMLLLDGALLAGVAAFALPQSLVRERPWLPWALVLAGIALPVLGLVVRAATCP
jgi:hypothetical protein